MSVYCFGVRPGGTFTVRDSHAQFDVVNYGNKLLRIDAEALTKWPDSTPVAAPAEPVASCQGTQTITPSCRSAESAESGTSTSSRMESSENVAMELVAQRFWWTHGCNVAIRAQWGACAVGIRGRET
jgi:hypothetical protein